jgi:anaerobic selenocysteine-containing dehydrogenase
MSARHQVDLSKPVSDEVRKTTCYMCACRCGIDVHLNDRLAAVRTPVRITRLQEARADHQDRVRGGCQIRRAQGAVSEVVAC